MDIKILILTALIGAIAAFAHVGPLMKQRDRKAASDSPVLPI
jgi:hypothetical protein